MDRWRRVKTLEDAEEYVEILTRDAEELGETQYPNVSAESVLAIAQDASRGYAYWIGESTDTGAKACYLIRCLPTDQGSPERNRPTVLQIGAVAGRDGVGWRRTFARAVRSVYEHIASNADEIKARSHWTDGRLRILGIDRVRGRLLDAELCKLPGARDAGKGADHRFSLEVTDGHREPAAR